MNVRPAGGACASELTTTGFERSDLWPSYAPKKNALSLTMRPPMVPPNWLIWPGGRGRPWARRFGFIALSDSSRKYSNALPVKRFDPDFVTTLITPPAARPNSAENPF